MTDMRFPRAEHLKKKVNSNRFSNKAKKYGLNILQYFSEGQNRDRSGL